MSLLLPFEADKLTILALQARVSVLEAELERVKNPPKSPFVVSWSKRNGLDDGGRPTGTPLQIPPFDPDPKPPKNKRRVIELPVAEGVHPVLQLPEARQVPISAVAIVVEPIFWLPAKAGVAPLSPAVIRERRKIEDEKRQAEKAVKAKKQKAALRTEAKDNEVITEIRAAYGLDGIVPLPAPRDFDSNPVKECLDWMSAFQLGILMAVELLSPGVMRKEMGMYHADRLPEMRGVGVLHTFGERKTLSYQVNTLGKDVLAAFRKSGDVERLEDANAVKAAVLQEVNDYRQEQAKQAQARQSLVDNQTRRDGLRPVA